MKPCNKDFKNCLDRKKLYKSDVAKALSAKELKSAKDDMEDADYADVPFDCTKDLLTTLALFFIIQ